ncbi:FlaG/FlaF family flagellin (archaellin) [Methanomicrobium sp. W14]|uniref:type IV pilin N-terminal domain-containing protein n=1 Tax=Methanomicrobium sp. W14 TaxID=2817839 RepID=UPI001AEB836B|nr:type IV pilin N-terminal domain-containing protein [Methanomicrobium sp. W14]MBP2133143.1 FlaG/FlaF family flagellin (archaellin) [Methanomicrobium sp. W14]
MKYMNTNYTAVSSVVSVMVMLSILLVISAVLAAYAGGIINIPKNAPSADISVYTTGCGQNFSIVFEHRTGDALKTENLQVVTFVDGNQGIFLLSNIQSEKFIAGRKILTENLTSTAGLLGLKTEELDGYLKNRTSLEIAVYDLPSGTRLYKSEVIMEDRA